MSRRRAANLAKFWKPELVLLRDPPVSTDNVPDNAGVATSIVDKDRICCPNLARLAARRQLMTTSKI